MGDWVGTEGEKQKYPGAPATKWARAIQSHAGIQVSWSLVPQGVSVGANILEGRVWKGQDWFNSYSPTVQYCTAINAIISHCILIVCMVYFPFVV